MAVRIEASYGVLDRARDGWAEQGRSLDGVARRMANVTGAALSARVAAEVERFSSAWQPEITALGRLADDNHDAFGCVLVGFRTIDQAEAERIRSLLPWSERNDPIRVF